MKKIIEVSWFSILFWLVFSSLVAIGVYFVVYIHPNDDVLTGDHFGGANYSVIQIDDIRLTEEDIDWEYNRYFSKVRIDNKSVNNKIQNPKQFKALRELLISQIIERKLLFKFIQKDKLFNLSDSSLYTSCLREWQRSKKFSPDLSKSIQDDERMKNALCEQSIVLFYLEENVYNKISISDEAVRNFYQKNQQSFKTNQQVVVRHIVLSNENDAKKIMSKLTSNNFISYAKMYSISPESEKGGELGPYGKGEMPQVFDEAFSMKVGEISGIMKSNYGYHIIMLERRLGGIPAALTVVHQKIRKILYEERREEEYKKLTERALNVVSVVRFKPLW